MENSRALYLAYTTGDVQQLYKIIIKEAFYATIGIRQVFVIWSYGYDQGIVFCHCVLFVRNFKINIK